VFQAFVRARLNGKRDFRLVSPSLSAERSTKSSIEARIMLVGWTFIIHFDETVAHFAFDIPPRQQASRDNFRLFLSHPASRNDLVASSSPLGRSQEGKYLDCV
jgi:hypothetical protein